MELILLLICIAGTWAIAQTVDSLTHLGNLLVPSPWLLGGIALVVVTWLMRD
ncbi:hypothetical protein IQ273_06185 [Nodosilinea sp. LEGE 07298]|uniref:hypothetical protein n=1 Tax=Nodosilinea sp. LEGE 07298 TaxID=2777970 RepID=UPI00187EE2F4|nr:hypothetical protein [Nodosilinea sp. LEGE 07298]MBE9109005.1 hypothetical protein [Nodosilinea sp. LEGE 07298]